MIYSWQSGQWQHLQQRIHDGRLAHALLFSGPEGIGKNDFARAFAQALLCSSPLADGQACQQCNSCRWFSAGAHPDFLHVGVAEDAKSINVEQIRSLGHFLSLKSQQGRYKVVIISPADLMNVNASNSLLKTLEEPTPDTIIVLVGSRKAAFSATIRSRCQRVDFHFPAQPECISWLTAQSSLTPEEASAMLSIAKGAPLHALAMNTSDFWQTRTTFFSDLFNVAQGKENPVQVSERWLKQDIARNLSWFLTAVTDMIKLNILDTPNTLYHRDYIAALQTQARVLNLEALYRCYEQAADAQRLLRANMNSHLLVESILINWAGSSANTTRNTH